MNESETKAPRLEQMDALIIQHSAASGTVLLNTTKGDGAADALRTAGFRWRWSRNIGLSGAWYIPHSRDRAPSLGLIERCADLLRAAGFTVQVQIDGAPRPMDDAAEAHMRFRHNPLVVVRRIERLEAERRSVHRDLDGYTRNFLNGRGEIVYSNTFSPASGQRRVQLDAQAAHLDEQIRYWNSVLDQARAAGTWTPVDRKEIRPGDLIKYRGKWLTVVRVNQKTVSVETGYSWTDKVPVREIVGHRRGNQTDTAGQQAS
jgi:hypothetical protein